MRPRATRQTTPNAMKHKKIHGGFGRAKKMSIYIEIEPEDFLGHMFNACSTDQVSEFMPEKRGFRIHGHSTTVRLERVFWTVLEDMSERMDLTMPKLIERIHDQCMVANDKNISSCLRVICMKYMNIYAF